ncbi:MAG: 3'-5' exoribonuclease [Sulfuricaulis sp.]|nr:3'-5' exoribonuclease [Sulfuricaulis sp.]
MKHIMLDLETMGHGNNAAIAAIGACEFNLPGRVREHWEAKPAEFYQKVGLESSVKAGMQIDTSTILWWMQQSDEARKSTFQGETMPLGDALHEFSKWIESIDKDVAVWGNGATFDNVIIRSAFKAVGLPVPWSFRNDKCYRTVANLLPKERQPVFERSGTAHNALDDAITQAVYLQKVWKELGL